MLLLVGNVHLNDQDQNHKTDPKTNAKYSIK